MVSYRYETTICTEVNDGRNGNLESRAALTIGLYRTPKSDPTQKPRRAKSTSHDQSPMIDEAGCARLEELIRLSPRTFGHNTSVWTRPLLAQQLHQEGYTARAVSATSISNALDRLAISWRRAKRWIHSPDPHYEHRKKDATG